MNKPTNKKIITWNTATFIVTSLIGFLCFFLYVKSYDASLFGYYILLNAGFSVGANLDFGFGIATVKYVSEAFYSNDFKLINKIFVSLFCVYILLALFIIALISVYIFVLVDNLNYNVEFNLDLSILFLVLAISFLFRYISGFLKNIFEGQMEFIFTCKVFIMSSIIQLILAIIIFVFNLSLYYLVFSLLITNFLGFLILFIGTFIWKNKLLFRLSFFDFSLIKKYSSYSIFVQLSYLVNGFIDPAIKYIISAKLGLHFVTFFEVGKKIVDFSSGVIFSAQKGLINKLSLNKISNTLDRFINEGLVEYSKLSNVYSIFIYGILNPFIVVFIMIWFQNIDAAIISLIFFLVYALINFAGSLYNTIVINRPGMVILLIQCSNLIFTVTFLYLSLIIFNNYLGLLGYYLATIISIVLIFYILSKHFGLNYKQYLAYSKFRDIILLSGILLTQIFTFYYFAPTLGYIYLLIIYFIVYVFVFHKYIVNFKATILKLKF